MTASAPFLSPSLRRWLLASAITSAAATTTTAAAFGYAGLRLLVATRPAPPTPPATVVAVDAARPDGSRALTLTGFGCDDPGWLSLTTSDGNLLLSPPREPTPEGCRRDVHPVGQDHVPLQGGTRGVVGRDPWTGNRQPFGRPAVDVVYPSPDGPIHATVVGPTDAADAVVFVHGRGGLRTTGWWIAPTCADRGWRVVMPSYRNDVDGPDGRGRYLLGGEWVDLAVVLDGLASTGVERVVLTGWSMGGNIVASYLRARHRTPERFTHHPEVAGVVFDAPALDWGSTLRHVARDRRIPRVLPPLVMTYGQLAGRIDWRDLNHLTDLDHLHMPMLTFHGEADEVVPLTVSHQLSAGASNVDIYTTADARHLRSANLDPAGYLTRLGAFLDQTRRG